MVVSRICPKLVGGGITPYRGTGQAPVSGYGAGSRVEARTGFYGMAKLSWIVSTKVSRLFACARELLKKLPQLPQLPRSKLDRERSSFGGRGRLTILNLPRFCRTCRICPHRDRFRDELDVRSVLATVRLLFSVLSIRELMCNYIDALMFLSRSNVEPKLCQFGRRRSPALSC